MPARLSRVLPAIGLSLLLVGCTHQRETVTATPAQAAPPPRPVLSPELAAVVPPPPDGAGGYRTINSGIDGDRTVWHLRAALNVAAIGCRGAGDTGTVAAYNAMLGSKKALLARENGLFQTSVKAAGGDSDAYMTRLYNYFAMPAAKPAFCAAAATLAPQAATTPPEAFPAFAQRALAELEAPFRSVYARVDAYRTASAAWDARYGDRTETRLAEARPPAIGMAADSDGAGHDDPSRAAFRPATSATPKLAYADLGPVIAWQPGRGPAYAAR